jgi:hypothetical protein
MRQNFAILRKRAGFVTNELPIVIVMLCLVAGVGLCFSGHCVAGAIVAGVGFVPLALLVLPSLFGKGR